MSYNKFNVLHWHIVDDQSFSYESILFPELSEKGAYTPDKVYTQKDVATLIEYARRRGIRVIPEFDTPGHTHSWGKSHPELLTPCYGQPQQKETAIYGMHTERQIMNPILNVTYTFLKHLFSEVVRVFPDEYVHLGMDEIYPACWMSNPRIKRFMKKNKLKKYKDLQQMYATKLMKIVSRLKMKYIVWQDPLDEGAKVSKDAIVEVWKNIQNIASVVEMGYTTITSAGWYLDDIGNKDDWQSFYANEPYNYIKPEHQPLVVGGEACLWAEYVDETNHHSRLWPRASAVAERLWSDMAATQNIADATYRIDDMRCMLLRRGIPAQPIAPGYCDYDLPDEEVKDVDDDDDVGDKSDNGGVYVPTRAQLRTRIMKTIGFNFLGSQAMLLYGACLLVLAFLMARSKCMHVTNSIVLHLNPQLGR
ncbi:PREDICTED: beta-hexosaminidase subunit beta-like [Priapulus caudatus]|uniref:beta-N-acetylhexosaminidase n=1 Tax=Priapulus caudatus TaxID=37621 RepID=A0ABM1DQ99_PRICU|nr:PREDICTED: beta-hexosaminidase subunit beta-like [Priapulus caudatus]